MAPESVQSRAVWGLARRQHGVVTRRQLLEIGYGEEAIRHRVDRGRLHRIRRGIYAVGTPIIGLRGVWMAAVLGCGEGAGLSHHAGAAALRIRPVVGGPIDVSVPQRRRASGRGLRVHRRAAFTLADADGIPVTSVVDTLVDLATSIPEGDLARAVDEADRLDLIAPDSLRAALEELARRPGRGRLCRLLDRATFRLTDSELERRFLAITSEVGLPPPETRVRLNGYRVDFLWRELRLVVEADGLRYHRTAFEQARDRERDQAHAAAGFVPLRFTHAQIHYERPRVRRVLAVTAARLRDRRDG